MFKTSRLGSRYTSVIDTCNASENARKENDNNDEWKVKPSVGRKSATIWFRQPRNSRDADLPELDWNTIGIRGQWIWYASWNVGTYQSNRRGSSCLNCMLNLTLNCKAVGQGWVVSREPPPRTLDWIRLQLNEKRRRKSKRTNLAYRTY